MLHQSKDLRQLDTVITLGCAKSWKLPKLSSEEKDRYPLPSHHHHHNHFHNPIYCRCLFHHPDIFRPPSSYSAHSPSCRSTNCLMQGHSVHWLDLEENIFLVLWFNILRGSHITFELKVWLRLPREVTSTLHLLSYPNHTIFSEVKSQNLLHLPRFLNQTKRLPRDQNHTISAWPEYQNQTISTSLEERNITKPSPLLPSIKTKPSLRLPR